MRPDDFEQRLRSALQTRAGDVTPDPGTWLRVRDRIERGQRLRWVTVLAAVAPLLVAAVAAAAVFGLLDRERNDLQLDTVPTPSPSGTASVAGSAVLVLAADSGIVLADADGEPLATLFEQDAISVARARPGDGAVAFLQESERCLGEVGVAAEGEVTMLSAGAICPTAPAWSPDGAALAYLERGSDGGHSVTVLGWDDAAGPPSSTAIAGDEGLSDLRLHDWVWTAADTFLVLTATDARGETGAYRLSLATPRPSLEPVADGVVAYADGGPGSPEYVIRDATLSWSDDGESGDLALPDGPAIWVTAVGDEVTFGDGVDDAWRVERRGSGWSEPQRLPGDVRFADLVGGVQTAPPQPSSEPEPGPTPSPSPSPTPTPSPSPSSSPSPSAPAVPAAVTSTRELLLQAAAARSYDQLAALLPADGRFTSNYGGMTDHIAFWQLEETTNGIDIFGELAAVLRSGPGTFDGTNWVWPPAYADPDAEYLGYRVGIDGAGTWRFFVAGD